MRSTTRGAKMHGTAQQRETRHAEPWEKVGSAHDPPSTRGSRKWVVEEEVGIEEDEEATPTLVDQPGWVTETSNVSTWRVADERDVKPLRPFLWMFLMLVALGGGLVLFSMRQAAMVPAPTAAVQPHTFVVDGVITRMGQESSGNTTITVVAANGRPTTARLDFARTSVFQDNGPRSISHLQIGQRVRLVLEREMARSVFIIGQPVPWGLR